MRSLAAPYIVNETFYLESSVLIKIKKIIQWNTNRLFIQLVFNSYLLQDET